MVLVVPVPSWWTCPVYCLRVSPLYVIFLTFVREILITMFTTWYLGSPKLLSLQIVGNSIEGTELRVNKRYWGGEEGDSVFRWFRVHLLNFILGKFYDVLIC